MAVAFTFIGIINTGRWRETSTVHTYEYIGTSVSCTACCVSLGVVVVV